MRARRLLPGLAALAVALLYALPSYAAWPSNPSVNVPLGNYAFAQYDLATCSDGAGGLFAAWTEIHATFDVYAQHVSSTGQLLWGVNGAPVVTAAGNQATPTLVPDGSGGLLVMWVDDRNGNQDYYAQHLNTAGAMTWPAGGMPVCTDPSTQPQYSTYTVQLVPDGFGGFITTWSDNRTGNSDIYVQRIYSGGSPAWTVNGVDICSDPANQTAPVIAADVSGGAYVAWTDARGAGSDIYLQHVNGGGGPVFLANGLPVCTAANTQSAPAIAPDGNAGVVLTWLDQRGANTAVYAQRISAAPAFYWPANGVSVCNATLSRNFLGIAGDGAGGAFMAWLDGRAVPSDLYVQHMNGSGQPVWTVDGLAAHALTPQTSFVPPCLVPDGANGVILAWSGAIAGNSNLDTQAQHFVSGGYALWPSGGVTLCNSPNSHYSISGATDGAGGLVAGWFDERAPIYQMYAQRVDRYGNLGTTEPSIASVRDVLGDQGGQVKLTWNASPLDVDGVTGIYDYRIWRSAPARLLAEVPRARLRTTTEPDAAVANGELLLANGYAWEYLQSQPAGLLPSYSAIVPTTTDSIAAGNPRTAFMVEAESGSYVGANYWYSAPDSGYSVDNLPPVIPAPFTGQYAVGSTHLHWNPNADADLAGYRLYRGTSAGFTPDGAHLVAAVADTGYTDAAGSPFYYKLSAVDVHGNESGFAALQPTGTTGVGEGEVFTLSFAPPSPNPARTGGGLTLRFTLPASSRVTLALYDAQGRQVRVLADGEQAAGETAVAFDGRDAGGARLSPGLYFARLDVGRARFTRRLALID